MTWTISCSTFRSSKVLIRALADISEPWKEVERKYVKCVWLMILVMAMQLLTDLFLSVCIFYLGLELASQIIQHRAWSFLFTWIP